MRDADVGQLAIRGHLAYPALKAWATYIALFRHTAWRNERGTKCKTHE